METRDIKEIYYMVEDLIKKHGKRYDVKKVIFGSKVSEATKAKPSLHIYGKKDVSIMPKRKPQPTYVCGVVLQKNFAGFYSMPLYSHAKLFDLSPELLKMKKGMSCINLKYLTPALLKEIEGVIKQSIAIYKKEGWI